jgi:hypothetical protein
VSVDDPNYTKLRISLVSTLRLAASPEALHLALLSPHEHFRQRSELSIPWSAIQVRPCVTGGYPAYGRDTFVELACGEPPVYIQLDRAILGDYAVTASG